MASQGESSPAAIEIVQTYLKAQDGDDEAKKKFEDEFVIGNPETHVLFEVANRAYKLDLEGLIDIACSKIAFGIKDKSPEWIKKAFNIKDDFSAAEMAEIRAENAWAFED
ncbi:suppressor of kinetochore protein mutant [Castilleja foliolosa]|uniref:Suppressor of kinetochore protein mutant n=1 Tax=Castilleja foliolosa TaxID=1961234 RepID=A0ABD3DKL1_9LAMI